MLKNWKAVALGGIMILSAGAQQGNEWMARAGEPLSDARVMEYLNRGSGAGAILTDVGQGFTNFANAINTQNTYARRDNHTGFTVRVWEPAAWLNRQKVLAERKFLAYTLKSTQPVDRLAVLRVVVGADMPSFVVGNHGNSVSHVVLRSTDRRMVAQPIYIEAFTQGAENDFGATVARSGSIAFFKMVDLEQVRGRDKEREFLVTVVGEAKVGKNYNRDFKVKKKHFYGMGDE